LPVPVRLSRRAMMLKWICRADLVPIILEYE
jgi:hypothetical protein